MAKAQLLALSPGPCPSPLASPKLPSLPPQGAAWQGRG